MVSRKDGARHPLCTDGVLGEIMFQVCQPFRVTFRSFVTSTSMALLHAQMEFCLPG